MDAADKPEPICAVLYGIDQCRELLDADTRTHHYVFLLALRRCIKTVRNNDHLSLLCIVHDNYPPLLLLVCFTIIVDSSDDLGICVNVNCQCLRLYICIG